MPARVSDKLCAQVCALYQDGVPVTKIMKHLGVSKASAYRALHQGDVPLATNNLILYRPKPYILPEISPAWKCEFRGFFYGEGNASVARYTRKNKLGYCFHPQLAIRLRADEEPLLLDIKSKLGGAMTYTGVRDDGKYRSNPSIMWYLSGYPKVLVVLEEILLNGVLPCRKRADIELLHEAVLARYKLPHARLGEEGRAIMNSYRVRIMEIRKYQDSC